MRALDKKDTRFLAPLSVACLLSCAGAAPGGSRFVPAGPPTEVRFQPASPSSTYRLQVQSADGLEQSCTLPCTLALSSGTARVNVSGGASYSARVLIPRHGGALQVGERGVQSVRATTWVRGQRHFYGQDCATATIECARPTSGRTDDQRLDFLAQLIRAAERTATAGEGDDILLATWRIRHFQFFLPDTPGYRLGEDRAFILEHLRCLVDMMADNRNRWCAIAYTDALLAETEERSPREF
jgi:hypothetical protein